MDTTTVILKTERRSSRRYRPPTGFQPEIRRPGWRGFFGSLSCKLCLNVSESGLRAVLTRKVREGQTLRARMGGYEVDLEVSYALPSGPHPGCWEAGLSFVDPAPDFEGWLRKRLLRWSSPVSAGRRADAWGEAR